MKLKLLLDEIVRTHGYEFNIERDRAAWDAFLDAKKQLLEKKRPRESMSYLWSQYNYFSRNNLHSHLATGVWIRTGDICFIDFGCAYQCEMGYLHFGIIYKIVNNKAFVFPITSNEKHLKENLFVLGTIAPMNKESYVILNDGKFINTARIIDVKAHVPPESELFQELRKVWIEYIS